MKADEKAELLRRLLDQLSVAELDKVKKQPAGHAFWNTQPVPQTAEELESLQQDGPIYDETTIAQIREQAVILPGGLQWCTVDIEDESELRELYELLNQNYVEDVQSAFRFDYQPAFLRWALQPPGAQPDWLVGIRRKADKEASGKAGISAMNMKDKEAASKDMKNGEAASEKDAKSQEASKEENKLVAFIAATPAKLAVRMHRLEAVEVNFLCLHKQLRAQRLAPLLIQEVTRRVYQRGIYQALYTAGIPLPESIARCQYFHRPLNYRRLVETGFSGPPPPGKTVEQTARLYDLGKRVSLTGWRPMRTADVPAVASLLAQYLQRAALRPLFVAEGELEHWLLPREGVIHSYVVQEAASGAITDFISFYSLPSTIVSSNSQEERLRVAYLFYYACQDEDRLEQLVRDALVTARDAGFDVFNCVESLANRSFFRSLSFQPGDGHLHYYLFNWRTKPLVGSDVAVTML